MQLDSYYIVCKVLFQTSIILIVLLCFYRKLFFSVLDPLLFFVIGQAFTIEMGFLAINDVKDLINFLLCQLIFVIAFVKHTKVKREKIIIDDSKCVLKYSEYSFWYYFIIISFVVVVVANLYLFMKVGIPLLSGDATVTKVLIFSNGGGLGFIRRINSGLASLTTLASLFFFVITREKRFLFIFFFLTVLSVLGGSKSAGLASIVILVFIFQLKSVKGTFIYGKLRKYIMPMFIVILAVVLFILSASSTKPIYGLVKRLLYTGDIILYYYTPEAVDHFQKLGFLDFFRYEFNSLFGLLRITPYLKPIGYDMVLLHFSRTGESLKTILGPNFPFYVKGHVFFGAFGALFYSYFIGFCIAKVRNSLFNYHSSYTAIILLIYINRSIFTLAQDSALLLGTLFDTCTFSIPSILLSLWCMRLMNNQKQNHI